METIKINKRKMIEIYGMLESLKDIKNTRFAYSVMRNIAAMKTEFEIIKTLAKPNEKYIEFDKERIALCEKFAKKDETGKPVFTDDKMRYVMESQDEFNKELGLLTEKHKDIIEEYKNKSNELNTMLDNDEVEIKIYKIKNEYLPDSLNARQLEILAQIIE